jgi:hypothetical protein
MLDLKDYVQKGFKFVIVGAIGTGVNLACLYIFHQYFHIWYITAEVLATVVAFVANFNGNILVKNISIEKNSSVATPPTSTIKAEKATEDVPRSPD